MIKVTLVGNGNVSHHLKNVFTNTENIKLIDVLSSRDQTSFLNQNNLPDIYILAVSDDAIATVSKHLLNTDRLVVHTSGSVAMNDLKCGKRKGVFYPLQTFSKVKDVDFTKIPMCIEATNKEDLELLKKLAKSISNMVYEISSEQRKSLHLAAVFVNNFTNHLYHVGQEICDEKAIPFEILKPLIRETVEKIEMLSPHDAQTGPAKRNDQQTIQKQLEQLQNKNHREVYQILTTSITETYGKKL